MRKFGDVSLFSRVDALGRTPLHVAVARNHVDCARLLLSWGADINAKDVLGRTSLMIAAHRNSFLLTGEEYYADILCTRENCTGRFIARPVKVFPLFPLCLL